MNYNKTYTWPFTGAGVGMVGFVNVKALPSLHYGSGHQVAIPVHYVGAEGAGFRGGV